MTVCAQPDCEGSIEDGHCDVCGIAVASASSAPAPPASWATQRGTGVADASSSGVNGASVGGMSALGAGRSSAGTVNLDHVGMDSSSPGSMPTALSYPDTAASGPSAGLDWPGFSRSSRRGSSRSTVRGGLGAGLVEVPRVPCQDPVSAVLANPEVPEAKRFCGKCGDPVGRSREGRPGRTEGFCRKCGTAYSLRPKLHPGELVAGQYEVLGCLAHGGLGWVYLARDHNVSDRWVVLKGLLDTGDAAAMAAAMAERQFLAEVEHPNIVKIYNFVQHPQRDNGNAVGYIVMEYVGGRSLRELAVARRQPDGRLDPLPLGQVIAYGLEVLPALGYLHGIGLLYCDFKPDNVIQTDEQLKLIDLGAVRRAEDGHSAVYGTVGYQAPEIGTAGPSITSDLYTVARTLAVLSFEFKGYTGTFKHSLPDGVLLFERAESFHRLLVRATDPVPHRRFGSAHEMAEQLTGVLREVMATEDGQPRPGLSSLFSPERRGFGPEAALVGDTRALDPVAVAVALPVPQVDTADPAAGFLATISGTDQAELVAALSAAPQNTVEVRLRLIRARIELGDLDAATGELDELERAEPDDWRVAWYRGLAVLAGGRPSLAMTSFDTVYGALPGEAAPKLALAASAECSDDLAAATRYYELVWRTDHSYVSAAFGLARVLLAQGDRTGAAEALEAVPDSSCHYVAAQVAAIRVRTRCRVPNDLIEADLVEAGARLDRLALDAERRERLAVELLEAAFDWVVTGHHEGSAGGVGRTVLDCQLTERELRFGLERSYRALARLARTTDERIALVDRANGVRPRTWV